MQKGLGFSAGPRIYAVILFTGAFGLCCSEAVGLREDVVLAGETPLNPAH